MSLYGVEKSEKSEYLKKSLVFILSGDFFGNKRPGDSHYDRRVFGNKEARRR